MVRQGIKATHKHSRDGSGFSGPSKFQGSVSKPNSVDYNRKINSGGLHKPTSRNSLSRDVHSPVVDHDLMPSLQDSLLKRHIPGCLNVIADLLSRLNQLQSTELSLRQHVFKQMCQKWFTPHVDLFGTHLTLNFHCTCLQ